MKNEITTYIYVFIVILVGVILIRPIGDAVFGAADYSSENVVNETITLVGLVGGTAAIDESNAAYNLANNDVIDTTACIVKNNTALVKDTDYTLTIDGANYGSAIVTFLNTTKVRNAADATTGDNTTYCTYTVYPDAYVKGSSVARTLLRLITIFFALAVIAVPLWLLYRKWYEGINAF